MSKFLAKRGIVHSFSPPYTPQLNGRVERRNRSLKDKVRASLLRAGAPKNLWADGILAAQYVINRTYIRDGQSKTAAQLWSGREAPPSIAHLRAWGCTAFVNLPLKSGEYEPLTLKVALIGYDEHHHGTYRFTSVNASFKESDFSAMHALRDELQSTEFAEEESDELFFGRFADENELKLIKMISLQEAPVSVEERKHEDAPQPDMGQRPLSSEEAPERFITPLRQASITPPYVPPQLGVSSLPPEAVKVVAKRRRGREVSPLVGPPLQRGERRRVPPLVYGKIDPKDIGQAPEAEPLDTVEEED